MVKNSTNSPVQLSLFSEKDTNNRSTLSCTVSNYLKTRGGLFRLLACFPGNMPVEQAIMEAPLILTKQHRKEGVRV